MTYSLPTSLQNIKIGSEVYSLRTGRAVPEVKQTAREADHSSPRADDKSKWCYTFTPAYAFVARIEQL